MCVMTIGHPCYSYSQGGCSVVRELHVYGSVVPVAARDPTKFQHQGFGTLLMEVKSWIILIILMLCRRPRGLH